MPSARPSSAAFGSDPDPRVAAATAGRGSRSDGSPSPTWRHEGAAGSDSEPHGIAEGKWESAAAAAAEGHAGEPSAAAAATSGYAEPRSHHAPGHHSSSTGIAGEDGGVGAVHAGAHSAAMPGGLSAEDLLAAEGNRHAVAAAAVLRRQRMLLQRLHSRNHEELAQLAHLHESVVKGRMATYQKLEADTIRSATMRARAAKHERKVIAIRTQRVLEDMARHTLSLRLARSSKQAAAASELLRAYASQQRAAAADSVRAAADDRALELQRAQASLAAVTHSMAVMAEVVKEETAKQVAQRQAAMRSQREALRRALSDMRTDEAALLAAIKDTQTHAEDAFLAEHVHILHPAHVRGGEVGFDAAGIVDHHLSAPAVDIDTDPGRVHTVPRVARVVDRYAADVGARVRDARDVMVAGAHDAAEAAVAADAMAADAGGVMVTGIGARSTGLGPAAAAI